MVDYFTEVFSINVDKIGHLTAYDIVTQREHPTAIIDDLLIRFRKAFGGYWIWDGQQIITDHAAAPMQSEITLDVLRKEHPKRFSVLEAVNEKVEWYPTAEDAARFVARCCEQTYDSDIRTILRAQGVRIHNGYIMRDYLMRAWEVDGQPALSFSLVPRVLYLHNVQATLSQGHEVIGLQVIDKTNARNIGIIQSIHGTLKDYRDNLLTTSLSSEMNEIILDADDDTSVVCVSFGAFERDYVATALNIILQDENYEQFDVDADSVTKASTLPPDEVAKVVSDATEILKTNNIIGNAYNNRVHPQHFIYLDHVPEMEFANQSVRPYRLETLTHDFSQYGLFARHPRFKEQPVRIAVINTLDASIAIDFVEAMRRQIEKDFGLKIELIKARNVRVVSDKNLASALRAVEKENPHVLLACFADDQTDSYDYVHSLTLGKGIALQALYEQTMHNPDTMGWVTMGLLAKTGNVPFVLAEGFDSANLVVGLDWVRESLTRGDRLVGMSRVYRRDGFFMRYFMDTQDLEADATPPASMMQALFPHLIFKGKRVIIHHRGTIPSGLLDLIKAWGDELGAELMVIEIHTEKIPHIYGLNNGISQAPWGSVYLLNASEAFVVSSNPKDDIMPESIHLRIRMGDITIEQAIYSVIAMTLLSYGTSTLPRLPVTIQNGDKLSTWLARGMLPNNINGDVAFWL